MPPTAKAFDWKKGVLYHVRDVLEAHVAVNVPLTKDLCDLVKRAVNAKLEDAAQVALSTTETEEVVYDAVDYPDPLRQTIANTIRKLKV